MLLSIGTLLITVLSKSYIQIVRAVYFFIDITSWEKPHETIINFTSTFLLVDLLPEMLFVAIYLLLVASWYDSCCLCYVDRVGYLLV